MSEIQSNNQRIAKNTIILYFRMMLMLVVQLYTSRVVLQTLGVEDYGIYNVVGGIVGLFVFFNSAMTSSTQRYLTFELGKGDYCRLKQVFATAVNIHLLIAVIIILLCETVGLWLLFNKMIIPESRMTAALWVFQLSILTSVVTIMSYPYNAIIVAHERMSAFAYISIIEVVLKLVIVFLLKFGGFDKLILYAILITLIQLTVRFIYSSYCSRNFSESRYSLYHDKKLFKEMLSFAAWNLWGNFASAMSGQGQNILLNVFCGPLINAARGVASQVQVAIHQLSTNFQMALNPQITKNYASGRYSEMHLLIQRSSRISFFLLYCISLPVIIEAPFILDIWLKEVPDYTVHFLRIMLCICMIDSSANPLMIAAAATGNVRKYQSIVGGVILMVLPLSYIVLKSGAEPWSVIVVQLIISCVAYITRLCIVKPLIKLELRSFFTNVIMRCGKVVIVSSFVPLFLHCYIKESWVGSCLIIIVSLLSSIITSFFITYRY